MCKGNINCKECKKKRCNEDYFNLWGNRKDKIVCEDIYKARGYNEREQNKACQLLKNDTVHSLDVTWSKVPGVKDNDKKKFKNHMAYNGWNNNAINDAWYLIDKKKDIPTELDRLLMEGERGSDPYDDSTDVLVTNTSTTLDLMNQGLTEDQANNLLSQRDLGIDLEKQAIDEQLYNFERNKELENANKYVTSVIEGKIPSTPENEDNGADSDERGNGSRSSNTENENPNYKIPLIIGGVVVFVSIIVLLLGKKKK